MATTEPNGRFEGKVAIVTGGGSGIGRAFVHGLSDEGATVAIAELNSQGIEIPPPGLGHRISIWSLDGKQLARLGDPEVGEDGGRFIAPHGIAVDSNLDVYVGEVTYSVPEVGGRYHDPPKEIKSLKKLRRL